MRIYGIPLVTLLLILGILLVPVGYAAAQYLVQSVEGTVTVPETFEVSPATFEVTLWPGSIYTQMVDITNVGLYSLDAHVSVEIDPGGQLVVHNGTSQFALSVESNQTKSVPIQLEAPANIVPGVYTVTMNVTR